MEDLFDAKQNADMLARIDALKADLKAQWGKMNAAQMCAHCQVAIETALGRRTLKPNLMGKILGALFGKTAKRNLLKPIPFGKNLPTAPEFKIRDSRQFDAERAKLRALVVDFGKVGPAGLSKLPHPFFGPMNAQEWTTLQWKHLDHHFKQFGV